LWGAGGVFDNAKGEGDLAVAVWVAHGGGEGVALLWWQRCLEVMLVERRRP